MHQSAPPASLLHSSSHLLNLGQRLLHQRARPRQTGVVDQQVDAAGLLHHRAHSGVDRGLGGDIQLQRLDVVLRRQLLDRGHVPGCRIHRVAVAVRLGRQAQRQRAAQARGAAGNLRGESGGRALLCFAVLGLQRRAERAERRWRKRRRLLAATDARRRARSRPRLTHCALCQLTSAILGIVLVLGGARGARAGEVGHLAGGQLAQWEGLQSARK